MPENTPTQFDDVSVVCKANIFFDGGVISHTVLFKDGSKKTLGLIRPGTYKFDTKVNERMDVTSGSCRVKVGDASEWTTYPAGTYFTAPGGSSFEITIDEGIMEYICSFD